MEPKGYRNPIADQERVNSSSLNQPFILLTSIVVKVKANDDAFKNLATKEELNQLMQLYIEYFSSVDDDDHIPVLSMEPALDFGLTDVVGGDLGMGVECKMNPDQLATRLGFLKQRLPLQFNHYRHRSLTPWDMPQIFTPSSKHDSLDPLKLHWHQLAGVHSIIRQKFTKKPTSDQCLGMILCDEVGLGKTGLALATIAFLSQCVLIQTKGGTLPKILGKVLSIFF